MNIEHIGVYAHDSVTLTEWYSRVLGLKEVGRIEREGRAPVVFLQGEKGAVVEILPTDARVSQRNLDCPGYSHLGVAVTDIEREKGRLADAGVELTGVRTTSNGWTIGYFRDPEGNVIELIER